MCVVCVCACGLLYVLGGCIVRVWCVVNGVCRRGPCDILFTVCVTAVCVFVLFVLRMCVFVVCCAFVSVCVMEVVCLRAWCVCLQSLLTGVSPCVRGASVAVLDMRACFCVCSHSNSTRFACPLCVQTDFIAELGECTVRICVFVRRPVSGCCACCVCAMICMLAYWVGL